MEEKLYMLFDNFTIGYIKDICDCVKCKERGELEIFINNLDNNYLDCIKLHELEDMMRHNIILTVGNSISEIMQGVKSIIESKDKTIKFLNSVNQYLNNKIVKEC